MEVTKRDILRDATEAQRLGSDPGWSAWVSASAGSGKTKVLGDRVLRLLLRQRAAGKHPLPHLHQGGGGGNVQPRGRAAGEVGGRCA